MKKYPEWLKLTIAFSVPAVGSLVASLTSTGVPMALLALNALYAGLTGLAGLGVNQTLKDHVEQTQESD